MKTVFQCAQIMREAIQTFRLEKSWILSDSLDGGHVIPQSLESLLNNRWIIIEPSASLKTQHRNKYVKSGTQTIAQNILYACKSDRQVAYVPKHDEGEFRQTYGSWYWTCSTSSNRSKKEVDMMHGVGYSVDYQII